jgi:outer membrane lipoprotein-sorting protein
MAFNSSFAQELSAVDIVLKADEKQRGKYNQGERKMSIIRPDWTRVMKMKSWASGDDFSLVLVTAPARDKGTAFLKRKKELWNWQPTIDRVIKMPPSMMSQSWMGSDFTNDDLVKQSSIVKDYQHEITGKATIEGRDCWEITLIPTEESAVVWGKVNMWIDKKDFLQLKTEFYDEDDYLVNTMVGKKIGKLGDRILPLVMEVIPAEEEGHLTRVEYLSMNFDKVIKDNFFSVQNMKRVR